MKKAVLVLDCGATNVRACLVETTGKILSSHSLPNETIADPNFRGGLIWDINDIWNKLASCSRKACSEANGVEIIAVTVTTFGVDGAPMKKDGTLCYPVVSWQCSRTESIAGNIQKYFEPEWLYKMTGLQSYHFNTIHKLIWFLENRRDVLEDMDYFVMMPSIILYRLSGELVTDTTMAGTSMLTDNKIRDFSGEILNQLGLNKEKFPPLVEPGTIIGRVKADAAETFGIKSGIAVIASGHDTQFALLGSGAGVNQAVLSSGTWEILMIRALSQSLQIPSKELGVTIEFDSQPGLVDIGIQWVASGVLEWISRLFYSELEEQSRYSTLIREAELISAGCEGITMIPELFTGGFSGKRGLIEGFTHKTTRAHIYRAALEALSYYTCFGLKRLQQAGNCQVNELICVGGGSKNSLWNQIRANVLGIPVKVSDIKETTALGAAMTVLTGLGIYNNIEEAFNAVEVNYLKFEPDEDKLKYRELYSEFIEKVFQENFNSPKQ
jgi:L-fuculokinase